MTSASLVVIAIPMLLSAATPSYYRDVRPILEKNCTSCHQPAAKQSELDLTTYARFQAGGKRGAAFLAGSPEESLVIKFITGAVKPSMPFGQPLLAAGDAAIIRDWIASGARDDSPSEIASTEPTVYHQPPVITALRFSPDGKLVAVGGDGGIVMVLDAATGEEQARLRGHKDSVRALAFSPDGRTIISGSQDKTAKLWQLED